MEILSKSHASCMVIMSILFGGIVLAGLAVRGRPPEEYGSVAASAAKGYDYTSLIYTKAPPMAEPGPSWYGYEYTEEEESAVYSEEVESSAYDESETESEYDSGEGDEEYDEEYGDEESEEASTAGRKTYYLASPVPSSYLAGKASARYPSRPHGSMVASMDYYGYPMMTTHRSTHATGPPAHVSTHVSTHTQTHRPSQVSQLIPASLKEWCRQPDLDEEHRRECQEYGVLPKD